MTFDFPGLIAALDGLSAKYAEAGIHAEPVRRGRGPDKKPRKKTTKAKPATKKRKYTWVL